MIDSVIFLDIDGVLIPSENHSDNHKINDKCFDLLAVLVKLSRAKVVITSTWRKSQSWLDDLKEAGWDIERVPICGCTESSHHNIRGKEISDWIRQNQSSLDDYFRYVIIDDECDMTLYQLPYFIHVKHEKGLQDQDMMRAHDVLTGLSNECSFSFLGYNIECNIQRTGSRLGAQYA